ncbi:MAG: Gfo/Idh/MocA family oxidoreductase, partial [bacterium]
EKFRPDVFIIANPTTDHLAAADLAADYKCHIFMEKPIAGCLTGISSLKKKILKNKLLFFLANNFRFHPALIKIKNMIETNRLGNIYFARIMVGQYLPDWHPYGKYSSSYSARSNQGGGAVLTLQHEIDYAFWLFGKFKKIKAITKKASGLKIDVEDIAAILIETESGVLLEIHLDYLQRPAKRTLHIQGSKGSVYYDFISNNSLKFYDFKKQVEKEVLDLENYNANNMYIEELKHFISCIKNNRETHSPMHDAVYVLKQCLRIKKGIVL